MGLLHVSRILQEACTNILKHSNAEQARVRIGWNDASHALEVEITDDGASTAPHGAGRGLSNMSERTRTLGGVFSSGPIGSGKGWRVRFTAPGA
jgi:signal transduction histidine kinase